jgi:hypothetical protein
MNTIHVLFLHLLETSPNGSMATKALNIELQAAEFDQKQIYSAAHYLRKKGWLTPANLTAANYEISDAGRVALDQTPATIRQRAVGATRPVKADGATVELQGDEPIDACYWLDGGITFQRPGVDLYLNPAESEKILTWLNARGPAIVSRLDPGESASPALRATRPRATKPFDCIGEMRWNFYDTNNPPVTEIGEACVQVLGLVLDARIDENPFWDVVAYWPKKQAWTVTRAGGGAEPDATDFPVQVMHWTRLPIVALPKTSWSEVVNYGGTN